MADEANNYVVGSGRLLFREFAPGTRVPVGGFRYFGNTPAFSMAQSVDTLDHYDSDHGARVKDDSVDLSQDNTGSFSCDNISLENVALWFKGEIASAAVLAGTGETDTFVVRKGDYYQLGIGTGTPMGVQFVDTVTAVSGATNIPAAGNWEVNLETGVVQIYKDSAALDDGDPITFTYNYDAQTPDVMIAGNRPIFGELKFEAINTKGENKDFFFPYVKLTPDGDFGLKGTDWQEITFGLEFLKRDAQTARLYVKPRLA